MRAALIVFSLFAAGAAVAQQPAAIAPAPAPPGTTLPLDTDLPALAAPSEASSAAPPSAAGSQRAREGEGIAGPLMELVNLEREVANARRGNELLETHVERQELQAKLNTQGATLEVPELVALYGYGDNLLAEFLVGRALLTARPGDWVTSEFRLERVLANGVELRKRDGSVRTALFGRMEAPGNLARSAPTASPQRPPSFTPVPPRTSTGGVVAPVTGSSSVVIPAPSR